MEMPTDDDIRAMLSDRASRLPTAAARAETILAAARAHAFLEPRSSRRRLAGGRWAPRVAGGVASLAAVALTLVVLAVPLIGRPSASVEPSAHPSASAAANQASATPAASPEAEIGAITAEELQALFDARGTELVGLTVAVDGDLVSHPSCSGKAACVDAIVGGTTITVLPVGDIGPGPWDGSGPISGTFALRLVAMRGVPQGVVAQYLGDIRPGPNGLAWSLADIIAGESRQETGFVVARGWLVRSPLHSCPTSLGPSGRLSFGCPSDDYLSIERFQPMLADGSSISPPATDALYLPSGTYDEWAPDPAPVGVGVEPREGTFLLAWTGISPCGPLADCAFRPNDFRWTIRGRLDPTHR